MLVLAHRGYHADLPENTLAAFDAALQLGADGIETDVRFTRDGVPILFHDRAINRRLIDGLTHAELNTLAGFEVPTLVSALDAFPDTLWNLEIKMPTRFEPVLPLLKQYGKGGNLMVSSFWHPLALRVQKELGIHSGLLVAHRPVSLDAMLSGIESLERLSIVWNYEGIDAQFIDEAHFRGVNSFLYGVDGCFNSSQIRTWEIAGVITDNPRSFMPEQYRGAHNVEKRSFDSALAKRITTS